MPIQCVQPTRLSRTCGDLTAATAPSSKRTSITCARRSSTTPIIPVTFTPCPASAMCSNASLMRSHQCYTKRGAAWHRKLRGELPPTFLSDLRQPETLHDPLETGLLVGSLHWSAS